MNVPEKIWFERTTIGARQVNSSYHQPVPLLGELGPATSSQLLGTSPSVIIPLGSTEQHGPHLPLDTDTRIATAVARGAVAALGPRLERGWLVAPLATTEGALVVLVSVSTDLGRVDANYLKIQRL